MALAAALMLIFVTSWLILYGVRASTTRVEAQSPGIETERSIQDTETGSYFVRGDGVLLLRRQRYDIRDFRRSSNLYGLRTAGNLLQTAGSYELRENMKLVLLPYKHLRSQGPIPDHRFAEMGPPAIWNVLGTSGWYEIGHDMQLLLYPARAPVGSPLNEPPSFGLNALSRSASAPGNRIGGSQSGSYFISQNGALHLMQTAAPKRQQ